MGRAVLAEADGIVGVDEDRVDLHQRGHAHRVARIFHEHQEGRAIGLEAAVQGHAIHDRRHAELAHAVVDVVAAGVLWAHALGAGPEREIGASQVGGAAEQFRQQRSQAIERVLRGLAGGDLLGLGIDRLDERPGLGVEILGQLAGHAALELGGLGRERGLVSGEPVVPILLVLGAALLGVPGRGNGFGNLERRRRPAERLAGQGDLVIAECRAVTFLLALLVRRAEADDGLTTDQARLVGDRARLLDRRLDRLRIMAVDLRNHMPVIGLEALRRVIEEPSRRLAMTADLAVDRDIVVVIEGDQLA